MLTIYGARTRRLWPHLVASLSDSRSRKRRCIVLVPEQYTLQAEEDLIKDLSLPGFFDINVASFSRCVIRLFELCGSGCTRIDDNGRNIALAQSLIACRKKLLYYGNASRKRGFVSQACAWISAMKKARVDPDAFIEYVNLLSEGNSKEKMHDLALLYKTYSGILADKYVDGEDALEKAILALPYSDEIKDADIFVYGFDIITEDLSRFLCAVNKYCHSCSVYLVMDREDSRSGDLFSPIRESAERLRTALKEKGLKRNWIWLDNAPINAPDDIRFLESGLLCPSASIYQAISPNISLFEASSVFSETSEICQRITLLLRNGSAPESICILCGNIEKYYAVLESQMYAYGIPAYFAYKEPLLLHGVSEMLLSALRCAANGYRREDVINLIKSGYSSLPEEMCWTLENYSVRYGISGRLWRKPFTRGSEDEISAAESARQKIIPPLEKLQSGLKTAANAEDSLRAVIDYLIASKVPSSLSRQEDLLEQLELESAVIKNRQVWSRLLFVFEQLCEISPGSRITARSMISLLEAGLMENSISSLPPTAGCIYIGQIGNLIPSNPLTVFACGLDSSMDSGEHKSLLTEDESDMVCSDLKISLGACSAEKDILSELDIWKALSSPVRELHLSYSRSSISGACQRPSQTVLDIKRLFPALQVYRTVSDSEGTLFPLVPDAALEEIGMRIRNGTMNGSWTNAWKWLMQSSRYQKTAQEIVRRLNSENNSIDEKIPSDLSRTLFKERIISISRLEKYAECPYSHFVQYGLRPSEQKEWGVDPRDAGVFFHAAMEGFTRILPQNPSWPIIGRKECDQIMSAALKPLTDEWKNSAFIDNARSRAEARRYIDICKRVAWIFTRGAKESRFRPSEMEVSFGYPGGPPPLKLLLQDGTTVLVRGRIDRIDRFDSGDSVYLRVVDYKSGEQKLDPAKIQVGMQLQLLLYLEAALNSDPHAIPAGAFYQWMGNPLVDQDKKHQIEQEIAKKLCLKGVMLNDVQVIQWMDQSTPPVSIEDALKKDGTPKSGKLVCSLEEMELLIHLAHKTAVNLTEEIRKGDIRISPISEGTNIVRCKFCAFAGVCRRDSQNRPQSRQLPDTGLSDLLQNHNLTDPM